jgi:hypothetical protein
MWHVSARQRVDLYIVFPQPYPIEKKKKDLHG